MRSRSCGRDWITARFEWSLGLTMGFAPSLKEVTSDGFIPSGSPDAGTRDATWAPPPLWYGRIKGHEPSFFAIGSTSPESTPSSAAPGRFYGESAIGAQVLWDHDPWGKRYPTAYGGLLEAGLRNTSADFRYVTAVAAVDLRWYPVPVLGFSLVPVRVEAGVEVGGAGADPSGDVQATGGRQYYLQLGSRLGLALSAGLVDLLVQGPTLTWRTNPLNTSEIVNFQIGIKL